MTQPKEVSDYVSRGRRLEHTPVEALAGAWINLMRAWAAAPEKGPDIRLMEIEAEYSLRDLKPPYELVKSEMDALANAAHQSVKRGRQQ
jgi:hypothetical protein